MRILIAEDDDATAALVDRALRDLGHLTTRAADGDTALRLGRDDPFDVAILDRMLPGVDGVAILQRWRAAGVTTPVLMLTALGGIADRVAGLEAGADDYLVKPFAMVELAARIAALIRRRPSAETPPTRLVAGDVVINLLRRDVHRGDREIRLQPREFAVLEFLMRHAGRIVTRTMFLEGVWRFHFDPQTNIVESHLSRMRAKLNDGFDSDPIETLRGIGYRMRDDA